MIPQQELQRMLARRQADFGLCLTVPEMQVAEVAWDGLTGRRQIGIDQQMVMTGVLLEDAGGRHAHPAQPEINGRGRAQCRTILQLDEIDAGAGR